MDDFWKALGFLIIAAMASDGACAEMVRNRLQGRRMWPPVDDIDDELRLAFAISNGAHCRAFVERCALLATWPTFIPVPHGSRTRA